MEEVLAKLESVVDEVVERELLRARETARARMFCAASDSRSMDTVVLDVSYFFSRN